MLEEEPSSPKLEPGLSAAGQSVEKQRHRRKYKPTGDIFPVEWQCRSFPRLGSAAISPPGAIDEPLVPTALLLFSQFSRTPMCKVSSFG
jgi:hypothetical protein